MNADLDSGAYVAPAAGKITLEEYAKPWRSGRTNDPATLQQLDSRLRRWVYGTPTGALELIFATEDGKAIDRDDFNIDHWHAARRATGVAETRENGMHVLRHTAASAWLTEGVDIKAVSDWLGHSNPAFTLKTYIHFMPAAADRGREAMDAFFDAADRPGEDVITGQSAPDVPGERSG